MLSSSCKNVIQPVTQRQCDSGLTQPKKYIQLKFTKRQMEKLLKEGSVTLIREGKKRTFKMK